MPTMTAAERRAEAAQAYNAFLAGCPTRQLLDALSDKWVGLSIAALADAGGSRRFSELARTITGVSQKMLTQTLRRLERDGLVSRTVTASVPARVDYALTPLGWQLVPLLQGIKAWAEEHMDDVQAARADYDARLAA